MIPNHYKPKAKIIWAILLFSCICCLTTFSQFEPYEPGRGRANGKSAITGLEVQKLRARWAAFGFLNLADPNFTVGAEYAYGRARSIGLDLGYIYASNTNTWANPTRANGLLLRLAHRWYVSRGNSPLYLEAELFAKTVKMQPVERWVNRGVVAGIPAYEQLMMVRSRKQVLSFGPRFGQHIALSRNGIWGAEWAIGMGIRYRRLFANLPADAELPQPAGWFLNFNTFGESRGIDLQINLRVTYTF
ncbi:MAG: hypothetical protein MUF24_08860 [Chitinophagaceae bacterium]|nr:hypothetical protein [Chitinophagaceae bacterium]